MHSFYTIFFATLPFRHAVNARFLVCGFPGIHTGQRETFI